MVDVGVRKSDAARGGVNEARLTRFLPLLSIFPCFVFHVFAPLYSNTIYIYVHIQYVFFSLSRCAFIFFISPFSPPAVSEQFPNARVAFARIKSGMCFLYTVPTTVCAEYTYEREICTCIYISVYCVLGR